MKRKGPRVRTIWQGRVMSTRGGCRVAACRRPIGWGSQVADGGRQHVAPSRCHLASGWQGGGQPSAGGQLVARRLAGCVACFVLCGLPVARAG